MSGPSHLEVCVKCGWAGAPDIRYAAGEMQDYSTGYVGEHLDVSCKRCYYTRREPCLDAPVPSVAASLEVPE